jgi:hypothetical protein
MYYTVPWDGNDIKYQMNRQSTEILLLGKAMGYTSLEHMFMINNSQPGVPQRL